MYWINGIPQAQLSLTDRTIHFGDGFFTTLRVVNGDIPLLIWHLERLDLAAQRLLFSPFDTDTLHREILIAAENNANGVLKVLISRGSGGGPGYSLSGCSTPMRIVMQLPAVPERYIRWRRDGVKLRTSSVRLARNPLLAGIKHNNRLEQVLICAYLERNSADEALVLDSEGVVTECASANLFWRCGQDVFTPALHHAGVAGVMRRYVITLLPILGYTLTEVCVNLEVLATADEVFITNALLPIAPVKTIDEWHYSRGTLYLQLAKCIK